jgi:predicted small lipoprotein YifL
MKLGGPRFFKRSVLLAMVGILLAVLTACTGKGGGYLPPNEPAGFTGQAPFGFTFSCEDKGGINPPTGKLSIELAYADQGTNPTNPIGSSFGIHGIVDTINPPELESLVCSGQIPPPEPLPSNVLIFLGRYRLTSGSPSGFPSTCPARETKSTPLCRFEVEVHDNDGNLKPSKGDFFSIQLSNDAGCAEGEFGCSALVPGSVVYARAGVLAGGNITVK